MNKTAAQKITAASSLNHQLRGCLYGFRIYASFLAAERTGNMLCLAAIKITAADLNYAWPSSYLLFLKCQACEGKHEMSLWLIASLMLLFY